MKKKTKQVFCPFAHVNFQQGKKIVNSCPNAVKWLYLHCNFQNFLGEHAPGPP